ncbi:MAG: hypothetical protein R2940_16295 [Syntrophotaleaceae bacterium]
MDKRPPPEYDDFDDFIYQERRFQMAFQSMALAKKTEDAQSRARLWTIVQFNSGMIDEAELKERFPGEAGPFLESMAKDREEMVHPAMIQTWTFEIDLLADRKSLQADLDAAKKQFDYFCEKVLEAREKLGKLSTKDGSLSLDDITDYPAYSFRKKTYRHCPFDEWRKGIDVWWLSRIEGLNNAEIQRDHYLRIFRTVKESGEAQKEVSKLVKKIDKLVLKAASSTTHPL